MSAKAWRWVALPVSWAIMMQVAEHVFMLPLCFSLSLVLNYPELLGTARYVGAYGTDLIILSGTTIASCLITRELSFRRGSTMLTAFAAAIVAGMPWHAESGQQFLPMKLVQPAFTHVENRHVRWSMSARNRQVSTLDRLSSSALMGEPGLIVWPEGGDGLYNSKLPARRSRLAGMTADSESELLIAGLDLAADDRQYSVVQHVARGRFGEQASKTMTVPITERFLTEGEPTVIRTGYGSVGIAICFDSLFTRHSSSLASKGAEVLLTVSNDSSFGLAAMTRWHAAYSILRGIELSRPVVFLSNHGPALYTDSAGRLQKAVFDGSAEAVYHWLIPKSRATTVFAAGGMYIAPLAAAVLLLLALTTRKPSTHDHGSGAVINVVGYAALPMLVMLGILLNLSLITFTSQSPLPDTIRDGTRRFYGTGIADGIAPVFTQTSANTCGAASIAYMLTRLGDLVLEGDVLKVQAVDNPGMSFQEIANFAAGRGFLAHGYKDGTVDDLPSNGAPPVLAHLTRGHYVVVLEAGREFVYFFDAEFGRTLHLPAARFLQEWSGHFLKIGFP